MLKSILALIGIVALVWLWANSGECTYCANLACYESSQCFSGCGCMKDITDPIGVCVPIR